MTHRSGCLVCGRELKYFNPPIKLKCLKCGSEFESGVSCADGHYVCDDCHSKDGYAFIGEYAERTSSKNPVEIATGMMKHASINMHGPEHHYLIIAALLAAYRNAGGEIDLEKALSTARQRSKSVPGGICGQWGCCGAGIGAGIFISIISGATPMSVEPWSLANKMTSLSLEAISQNGGPRCCKRDTYLSILTAINYVREHFNIKMERQDDLICVFSGMNPSCRKECCLFYQAPTGAICRRRYGD